MDWYDEHSKQCDFYGESPETADQLQKDLQVILCRLASDDSEQQVEIGEWSEDDREILIGSLEHIRQLFEKYQA